MNKINLGLAEKIYWIEFDMFMSWIYLNESEY